jgi:hypothetical protein
MPRVAVLTVGTGTLGGVFTSTNADGERGCVTRRASTPPSPPF